MHEFILANLLFQVAAGATLLIAASGAAAGELHRRRSARYFGTAAHEARTVIDMPAARVSKVVRDTELEAQSKAA